MPLNGRNMLIKKELYVTSKSQSIMTFAPAFSPELRKKIMGNYFLFWGAGHQHLASTCHEVWLAMITYLSWGLKEPSPSTGGGNELDLRCSVCPATTAALVQCSLSYGRKAHVKKDFHIIKMNTLTRANEGIKWVQQHSYFGGKNILNVVFFPVQKMKCRISRLLKITFTIPSETYKSNLSTEL